MKNERNVLAFFFKRAKRPRVLFCSLQKNVAFFAFFSVLCKRTLCSLYFFPFFRKERKRMERSSGSHKLPKTREKNRKERNVPNGKGRSAQPCILPPHPAPPHLISASSPIEAAKYHRIRCKKLQKRKIVCNCPALLI